MRPAKLAGFVVGLALALVGCAPRAEQSKTPGVYVLTYGSGFSPAHPFSRADKAWIEYVEKRSGGRLKIKPFWGGALTSTEQSVIELRHGVTDIALISPIYSRSGMQAIKTQSGFYEGVENDQDELAVYHCLARTFPVFDQELSGVRVIAAQGGPLINILTKDRPIRRLADLRGLRLRAPSELLPPLSQLGVDVVGMSMAEVYSSLSKGVIDGVVAAPDTIRTLHFGEVTRYLNMIQIARGAYPARAISYRAWSRLPQDLQVLIDESGPYWEAQMSDAIQKAQAQGLEAAAKQRMVIVPIDPAEQQRFSAIYQQSAVSTARGLSAFGIDGLAIYNAAQGVVQNDGRKPPGCADRPAQ